VRAALSLLLPAALLVGCVSDIRPRGMEDVVSSDDAARGRALLEASAEAHGGLERWSSMARAELEMSDYWPSTMMRKMATPLPANEVSYVATFVPGSGFISDLAFTGEHAGEGAGVEGEWQYHVRDGERESASGAAYDVYPPSIQWFSEFPFRILEADVVAWAGQQTIDGRAYDRVYATWGEAKPNKSIDQYVVYLDAETHELGFVEYTVRTMMPFASAAITFEELEDVDGLLLPTRLVVINKLENRDKKPLHLLTVHEARFYEEMN